MTTPTQAQIMREALEEIAQDPTGLSIGQAEIAKAALTAAAQVREQQTSGNLILETINEGWSIDENGNQKDWFSHVAETIKNEIRDATIERCAQVCDNYNHAVAGKLAAAIRRLKDETGPVSMSIIYNEIGET